MSNNNKIDELNKEISGLKRSLVLHIKTSNEMNKLVTKMSADIERVRELHKPFEKANVNGFVHTFCAGCYDEDAGTGERFHDRYPCETIKALDGENIATDVESNITVTTYPMLMLSTKKLRTFQPLGGEQ